MAFRSNDRRFSAINGTAVSVPFGRSLVLSTTDRTLPGLPTETRNKQPALTPSNDPAIHQKYMFTYYIELVESSGCVRLAFL